MSTTASVRVSPFDVPGALQLESGPFPLGYRCDDPASGLDDALGWIAANRGTLLDDAARHGVVLFRDFPLKTDRDFDAFIAAFDLPNFPYEQSLSNAVRINRTPRVFTANEAPPSVRIYLHHEMAQTPISPSRLFFFCELAAESGGQTPVCRSDALWERIERECPPFAADCRAKGLLYTNVMPPANDAGSGMGRSWKSTLGVEAPAEAEARLAALDYTWEWLDDGSLRATTPVLPAVRDLLDGRTTFYNQILAASQGWKDARNDPAKSLRFGDGTPLPVDEVLKIQAMADELTFDVPWQTGDVALVDNVVAMHGRRSFTGARKVLASLIR